jgi:hypothetical protein
MQVYSRQYHSGVSVVGTFTEEQTAVLEMLEEIHQNGGDG